MKTIAVIMTTKIYKAVLSAIWIESGEDMKIITVANNMIYSESLGEMIIKGFYMKKKKIFLIIIILRL